MDNASNNDTFTTHLQKLFPSFGGSSFRSRCVAHILNLMAKVSPNPIFACYMRCLAEWYVLQAYLSVFSTSITRKRTLPANEATLPAQKQQHLEQGAARASTHTDSAGSSNIGAPGEDHSAGDDAGDDFDGDDEESRDASVSDNVDEDKAEYDEKAVKASVGAAFTRVEKEFNVTVPPSERHSAQ